ncbi:MAG: hypothetical protein FWG42_02030 [Clostridiales bacterium]|nr:hypothetical protein [Clostridiales bacterium]
MKTRNFLALLLVIGLFCALAACGGDKDAPLTGRYVVIDITDDPDGVAFTDLDAIYKGLGKNIEEYTYMEFWGDGKFTLVMFGEEEASGTYLLKGKTLTLSAGKEMLSADILGKKITWTYENGARLIFEKKQRQ